MRIKFTKAEREQFGTIGTVIEWRNGGHWHPGVTTGPVVTSDRWQSVAVKHTGRNTGTVHAGQRIDPGPTFIRLPAARAIHPSPTDGELLSGAGAAGVDHGACDHGRGWWPCLA